MRGKNKFAKIAKGLKLFQLSNYTNINFSYYTWRLFDPVMTLPWPDDLPDHHPWRSSRTLPATRPPHPLRTGSLLGLQEIQVRVNVKHYNVSSILRSEGELSWLRMLSTNLLTLKTFKYSVMQSDGNSFFGRCRLGQLWHGI